MQSIPILDNHIHLDRRGRFLDAVRDFVNSGGTHIVLVSKPSWTIGINIIQAEDYKKVFDETLTIAKAVREQGVGVFVVLGVHPAEISKLIEHRPLEEVVDLMKQGLDCAGKYVEKQLAVGLKSGRPHYPVSKEIWDASNHIIEHAMILSRELDCAVQLHTEDTTIRMLHELQDIVKKTGMSPQRVVKHYAPPMIKEFENTGLFPGIISSKHAVEEALQTSARFVMETDYIDDLKRPGAVLGPKTVPKKTKKLIEVYGTEPFYKVHKENPEKIYQIEINL
ncbi:MAG: TatD-related deoxyribonuclease [Candidatus Argoarchaeum ethanivorans]|uniref:TatD-related deoxyribonuclease n=1 Tax=Candidatus Argoarchaeum ethanivorans TaxID=2608793 RepID=A0A8B3S4B7_9EURY|nr:MAG: TatD-related deoxyribonuclease [Candidatus Argoarchaeum ethanivorans]